MNKFEITKLKHQNSNKIQIKFNNRNTKIKMIGFSHSLKIFFLILHFIFIIFHSSLAQAIEVSGHLTEDTTWHPMNNPYLVIEDVFVDDNVTLTVLPGTIVKLNAAPLVDLASIDNYFVYYNGSNIAKMIQVDGRISANGTEEEPITFTRIQDSLYYHWGIIYLREDADLCSFKYCNFQNSALMLIVLGIIPRGAISIYNEGAIVENCNFIDNLCGVFCDDPVETLEVNYNNFYNIENICPTYHSYVAGGINLSSNSAGDYNPVLIAGNSFMETGISWGHVDFNNNNPAHVVDNYFVGESGIRADMESETGSYIYNNEFTDCDYSGGIFRGEPDNTLYIKDNRFLNGGIDIDYAYVEISDNYFEECEVKSNIHSSGKIINNILSNGTLHASSYLEVSNNISFNGNTGITVTYRNEMNSNNLSINNQYAFGGYFNDYYNNCIILENDNLAQNGVSGNPIFRNCIIDFEIEYPLIDGGGNIIVDSLQTQAIFEDIQNGDFHLAPGSIAIDAGFDTLGYYYPFDIDYSRRVWDGDGNGTAIIDIDPYEYGSPAFGGIEGITYDPTTGDFVDYVLIKINNEPGEFTFSDSIGTYQYKLPAGVYDIYAERVFYYDAVEFQVEVIDGEFTQLDIPMNETVEVEEHEIPNSSNQISNLTNYPNPFNPTTTISFNVTQSSAFATIEIYNLKGQKVKVFPINSSTHQPINSVKWNGTDENNKPVSSGIYFARLKAGNEEASCKMLLLK